LEVYIKIDTFCFSYSLKYIVINTAQSAGNLSVSGPFSLGGSSNHCFLSNKKFKKKSIDWKSSKKSKLSFFPYSSKYIVINAGAKNKRRFYESSLLSENKT